MAHKLHRENPSSFPDPDAFLARFREYAKAVTRMMFSTTTAQVSVHDLHLVHQP